MMREGVKNLLLNLGKITLDGSRVDLGIDWARVIVPKEHGGDSLLDSGSPSELGQLPVTSVATTKQQAASGQPSDTSGPAATTPQAEEPGQQPGASETATEQLLEPGQLHDTPGATTPCPEAPGELPET